MDANKINHEVMCINGMLELVDDATKEMARMSEAINDIKRRVRLYNSEVDRYRGALSGLGVQRITYFDVEDMDKNVTKFVFLTEADYQKLNTVFSARNMHHFVVRFESLDISSREALRVKIQHEDITAGISGRPVTAAITLLHCILDEYEAFTAALNAFNSSVEIVE